MTAPDLLQGPRAGHPLAAVVIPTNNRVELLQATVASARAQSLPCEVIVVDDASTDGTGEWLRAVDGPRFRHIRLAENEERGSARNAGLALVTSPAVLFLDDDDLLRADALSALYRALLRAPGAVGAIGARVNFDEFGHRRRESHPRVPVACGLQEELLAGWISTWTAVPGQCLFRTDALREVGGWRTDVIGPEDQELLLRLSDRGTFRIVPRVVLDYRLHGSQWRHADVGDLETTIRAEALERLSGERREHGLRALRAGAVLRAATEAYNEERYADAASQLFAAARIAPRLATSPILGPTLVQLLAKAAGASIIGRHARGGIRAVRGRVRLLLRRAPLAKVRLASGSARRRGRGRRPQ